MFVVCVFIAYRISLLVFPYAIMELKSIHIREVRILFDGNNIRNESLLDCAPPVIKPARGQKTRTRICMIVIKCKVKRWSGGRCVV